jgi:CTP synthase
MAVIEYARNVLKLKDANSEEVNPDTKYPVVHMMEEQKKLIKHKKYGGTIRLGAWPCDIKQGSLLEDCYKEYANTLFNGLPIVQERHRHRYEFNNEYREKFEEKGLILSGKSPDGMLVEAIELPKDKHPFFVATQYHPELKSRFLEPHPIFMKYIEACLKKK